MNFMYWASSAEQPGGMPWRQHRRSAPPQPLRAYGQRGKAERWLRLERRRPGRPARSLTRSVRGAERARPWSPPPPGLHAERRGQGGVERSTMMARNLREDGRKRRKGSRCPSVPGNLGRLHCEHEVVHEDGYWEGECRHNPARCRHHTAAAG
ncbi:hypothetical protein QTO34_018125 [Cnephaeus nilssonii]|uniref:Uncharacterized protein n=1 Tax=Cnephaeus nilssonii TaxID=3371016 RepID=A0AA40LPW1_CNENI|nr:hypothetical protein QTO34_018125 [Eptesicus nilssonii]